jgi:site-specific recombinase XerD
MILMYDTAARCQEMLDLKLGDFILNSKNPYVHLLGKGRKTRTVPLMDKTVQHLNLYLEQFHKGNTCRDDYLFYTVIHGVKHQMSPDNVEKFIMRYGKCAAQVCDEIPKRVHPHQLRHTRSIHLYRGGMPLALLAEFLGHVEIETTRVYAYADTEMKRKAIQKACLKENKIEEPIIWDKDDEETLRKLLGL